MVLAPDPGLSPPSRVVATAWIYKQTCTALDPTALATFVDQRAGKGPDTP